MLMETLQIATTADQNSQFLKPFTSSTNSLVNQSKYECAICAASALYKCPKCSTRTCSAKCSKIHKEDQKCNGQSSISPKQHWFPIFGTSQFQEDKIGIQDQKFLHKLGTGIRTNIGGENKKEEEEELAPLAIDQGMPRPRQFHQLTQPERSLLQNAQFRRVWLRLDGPEKSALNNSHHEPLSDTIFWTCSVKFVCRSNPTNSPSNDENPTKLAIQFPLVDYGIEDDDEEEEGEGKEEREEEEESGGKRTKNNNAEGIGELEEGEEEDEEEVEVEEGEWTKSSSKQKEQGELKWLNYTVHNIAESIRLVTLLRQFLRPKPHGSVISRSQLDLPLLDPFIRASESILGGKSLELGKEGDGQLCVYLEVKLAVDAGGEEAEMRYFPMDPERTILENLRNRFVIDHPTFVILLRRAEEFGELDLAMMSEAEQKLLHAEREKQIGGNGNGFKDRPKWEQKRGNGNGKRGGGGGGGGHHRRRGGRGENSREKTTTMNRQQPIHHHQQNVAHPPYFYHPYVLAPNPYHAHPPPPPQYGQQQFGGGWQQQQPQQRSWMPQNKGWRGGGRN